MLVEDELGGSDCADGGDVEVGVTDVNILVGRAELGGVLADVEGSAGGGLVLVPCANVELGRIHERNSNVEDKGTVEFAHKHLLLLIRGAMSIVQWV